MTREEFEKQRLTLINECLTVTKLARSIIDTDNEAGYSKEKIALINEQMRDYSYQVQALSDSYDISVMRTNLAK